MTHSVYLLGQASQLSPLFKRYHVLMDQLAAQGEFLSYVASPEWLSCYEQDSQRLQTKRPLLVFRPHSTANIAPFLHLCYQMNLPVTVRCGGTGLAGGCVASTEGIILLTGHLNRILAYDSKEGKVQVEPGVTVRQLNRRIEAEGWIFPLSMATEGVAGLAGCLSCQARGYHQQGEALWDAVENVVVVDGEGKTLEVPSALVCGAEGLNGVIIEMYIQLTRQPQQTVELMYSGSWEQLLTYLPALRSLQTLSYILQSQQVFYLGLAGEAWRLPSAYQYISRLLPSVQPLSSATEKPAFFPHQKSFVMLTSALKPTQLPKAIQWAHERASELQLNCMQQTDVLAGNVHLLIQADSDIYSFSQKLESFFVLWVDFIDRQQGQLVACHGVGKQMQRYMTPFWSEETMTVWKRLQTGFDPAGLFSKERFFSVLDESLEKVRDDLTV